MKHRKNHPSTAIRTTPSCRHRLTAMRILSGLLILALCLSAGCGSIDPAGKKASGSGSAARAEASAEAGSSLRDDPLWADPDSLTAMIVSDLHYTENKDLDHSLVPGIALAEEITDAVIEEILARHPDVLIMTGDNTNSGDAGDAARLAGKLQRLRDAGIRIILTTGNHDFDRMDAPGFEAAYFGLLTPADRDPASLSYTSIVEDVVFLAMDDNAVVPGGQGEFSPATMQWLQDMLEKYSGRTIIFLSHHNVLYGYGEEDSSSHLIQNPDLPSVLRGGGVRLAMTGHMHFPYIVEKDGLWEVLSGMPFSGGHLVGNLAVGPDRILYYAEPIDFAHYEDRDEKEKENDATKKDLSLAEELSALDRENAQATNEILSGLLEQEGLHGTKKEKALDLFNRFFLYYGEGSLAEHARELRTDPSYKRMIKALWNYNYGPWMKEMIETTTLSARELEIRSRP